METIILLIVVDMKHARICHLLQGSVFINKLSCCLKYVDFIHTCQIKFKEFLVYGTGTPS